MTSFPIIGRAENIDIVGHAVVAVPAKVDTGADTSGIWASQISLDADGLHFVLFAAGSPYYSGQVITLPAGQYKVTRVASSFGHKEVRYVVKLPIRVRGRRVLTSFTLADRSTRTYPVLLGRRFLHKKFVVDVSQGTPLLKEERAKKRQMRIALGQEQD